MPLLAVVVLVLTLLYRIEANNLYSDLREDDFHRLDLIFAAEQRLLDPLNRNTLYLASHPDMTTWLGDRNIPNRKRMTDHLKWFMKQYQIYDQIRYINQEGMEEIRVDFIQGNPSEVPQKSLQNKAKRYYFQRSNQLKQGEIYVSPLDLNVERGKIELPFKPMLRVGTPVFDLEDQRQGILMLNYKGSRILDGIRQLKPDDRREVWLVNREGYWLLGSTPEMEWGFMLDYARRHNIANIYPHIWERMQSQPERGRLTYNQDFFTYHSIAVSGHVNKNKVDDDTRWYTIIFTPRAYVDKKLFPIRKTYTYLLLLISGLLLLLCSRLAVKEVLRARSVEQLRDQERQYRELLEGAPDSIVIVDLHGVIRIVNIETENATGYMRDELLGQNIEMLLPERFRNNHIKFRKDYLMHPIVRPMGESKDLFLLRKDGTEMPVEISLSPLIREDEQLVTAIVRDITQRKAQIQHIRELNQDLVRQSDELKTINSELESFSYSVSHDLRAPLRAVDGFSMTVLNEYSDKLDDRGKDRLQRIRKAAQNMAALIDDLLNLSRISRADVDRKAVNLSKLASDIINQLQESEPQRSVDVSIQPNVNAYGDLKLLKVMLTNLLSNAWKFTGKSTPARIEMQATVTEGDIVYFIRDNGAGFNMEYADKLFGAFQRLHDTEEFPGTGIGLATVKRVINKHGGRIWAESRVGEGATFYFTLGKE